MTGSDRNGITTDSSRIASVMKCRFAGLDLPDAVKYAQVFFDCSRPPEIFEDESLRCATQNVETRSVGQSTNYCPREGVGIARGYEIPVMHGSDRVPNSF